MGFLGSLFSSAVKIVITPLAILEDAGHVIEGDMPTSTIRNTGSAVEDAIKSLKELSEGDLL